MREFSQLLDGLVYTRSRNAKLKLIGDYLRRTPDPDRGYALAALTGELNLPSVKSAAIRAITEERVDPVLLYMSRDYVGDMAETVSLLWPGGDSETCEIDDGTLRLSDVVERLRLVSRSDAPRVLGEMLDHLDPSGRFALLKLATGALRVGISARLAKQALANAFGLDVDAVEEVWHGLKPPYHELFAWGEGRGPQPSSEDVPLFRPFMLAHPLDETRVSLDDYAAEWKWDGIRIQLVHAGGETRLYSRTGDDISGSFPDIASAFATTAVLDGELLVRGEAQGGAAASFNALQQRLGRKTVSAKMQDQFPAFVRLYDILFDGAEDLRALPWTGRRERLETFMGRLDPHRFDLSGLIAADQFEQLEEMRAVLGKAHDQHSHEHEGCQRSRDDDMARHREGAGDDAQHVAREDEGKDRENEREELHAVLAGGIAHHVGNELVADLGGRLQPARHQRAVSHGIDQHPGRQHHRDQHEQRGVGKGNVVAEQLERNDPVDLELMDRVRHSGSLCTPSRHVSPR